MATDNPDWQPDSVIANTSSTPGQVQQSTGEFGIYIQSGEVHMTVLQGSYELLGPNNPNFAKSFRLVLYNADTVNWAHVIVWLNTNPNMALGRYHLAPLGQVGCTASDTIPFPDGISYSVGLYAEVQYTGNSAAPNVYADALVEGINKAAQTVPTTH